MTDESETYLHGSLSNAVKGALVTIGHKLSEKWTLEAGLTQDELANAEQNWGFQFPPELRFFLERCLPVSSRFPNWRIGGESLRGQLAWPIEGITFDIRNNGYWRPEWGNRPSADDEATAIAITHLNGAPKLIPIFGHSYLPSIPGAAGNPVFSVYQTDIIHRGGNLQSYLSWLCQDGDKEDLEDAYPVFSRTYRHIAFWSDLARENFE